MKLTATTFQGLESVLENEIRRLGGTEVRAGKRIVYFEGDQSFLYRCNLELRTAIRVMVPIYTFSASNEQAFYTALRSFNWTPFINTSKTFAIQAVTYSETFNHSKYVALKMKDAISDSFRYRIGRRPSVDRKSPDIQFHLHINQNRCTVSLDASGSSLHQRGYKVKIMEAPMNEVLAAGLIQLSGWKADKPFIDPMCGSGTLAIEAAMYALNVPSQWYRTKFNFETWMDFDRSLWKKVRKEALARRKKECVPILAADIDKEAIKTTEINCKVASVVDQVELRNQAFQDLEWKGDPGIIMLNPPYDERLSLEDIDTFYKEIGDSLKQKFSGFEAWIISSNRNALKRIGLRTAQRLSLYNGPLESNFYKYELY